MNEPSTARTSSSRISGALAVKPSGELMVHQDAILNLGAELAERVGRQLLGFVSRQD
jgi:hypothetical protein